MAKEIELKEVEIEKNGVKETFSYKAYIERILDTPDPGQGFSLGDIRIVNKIQKQLDLANGTLVLEEQQWNFLKKKLETFRWGAAHPEIESFGDCILKAPQADIQKKDK